MAIYEILVTDVTKYGDRFCVAGQTADGAMIRPEPAGANAAYEPSRFWPGADAGPDKFFAVGNVVSFEADPPPAHFPYPHATEDRIVRAEGSRKILNTIAEADLAANAQESVSESIAVAFDGGLVRAPSGKAYVPNGFDGRSLGAVEVGPKSLTFHVNNYKPDRPKLRAFVREGDAVYDVAVTSARAHGTWKDAGLNALQQAVNAGAAVHLRLGLSRPFPARPDECYLQINGIFIRQ
jgi:hypothetical protein